jgi:hypothetical protein
MGTRSITHLSLVRDGVKTRIVSFYRHYDGYPEGHGLQMSEFLAGFPGKEDKQPSYAERKIGNSHNGADDLMFQLIAVLKMESGPANFYLTAPGQHGMGEEYTYDICFDDQTAEATIRIIPGYPQADAFVGSPQELIKRFGKKEEDQKEPAPQEYEDGVGY